MRVSGSPLACIVALFLILLAKGATVGSGKKKKSRWVSQTQISCLFVTGGSGGIQFSESRVM